MKNLQIEKTKITPSVYFQSDGNFKIEGRSIPEDPENFFLPLMDWLEVYFKTPNAKTKLDIQLEYVNSGSSKFILAMLKIFKKNMENGQECMVNWIYEEDDENLYELGLHYRSLLNMPFNLVEVM